MPRNDINPRLWGSKAWDFIDAVIEGYPNYASSSEQDQMYNFLISLGSLLPCEKCRNNYLTFVAKKNPRNHVGGRMQVKKWMDEYRYSDNPINQKLNEILRENLIAVD